MAGLDRLPLEYTPRLTEMPLLAKEPCCYPETLFQEIDDAVEESSNEPWWAIYTLPHSEKMLMRKLRLQYHRFYCPMVAKRHRGANGSVRTAYLPLFPNYVFLQGDEYARYQSVCTGLAIRVFPIVDAECFVEQMRSLRKMIDSNIAIEVESGLAVGRNVRVKSGPLYGRQGLVVQERSRQKFVVSIPLLGQSVSTLVDGWELELI